MTHSCNAELNLDQLSGIMSFIVAADKHLTITWASEPVLRRVENAVGLKVSDIVESIKPQEKISKSSISQNIGMQYEILLKNGGCSTPLLGQWVTSRSGFILLAGPDVKRQENLDKFSLADFCENDPTIELLTTREEYITSLKEARAAAKAIGNKNEIVKEYSQKLESANEELEEEITERKQVEEQLASTLGRLKALLNSATQVSVIATDTEGVITEFGKGAELMLGYTADEMVRKVTPAIVHLESEVIAYGQELSDEFGRTVEGFDVFVAKAKLGEFDEREWTYIRKDGTHLIVNLAVTSIQNADGDIVGFLGTAVDITERKRAEEHVRISLQEKEVLLKEVHHRVKNNLQIISSLLNLQAGKITDLKTREVFNDSMGRVKSMALIHERLYQSEDLTEIKFSEYVESLSRYLLGTITGNLERITIRQDVDETTIGVDVAVPCGLIINELVTNSMKYAFPNNEDGEIVIAFHRIGSGTVMLSVSDNGIGIPEHIDIRNTQSLGMQLVHSLTDQFDGNLQCDIENGTRFTIEFECKGREKEKEQHVSV